MSREFVLSVVVPTRNRAEYALGAVRQILAVADADLQLVIQDNSDDDSLRRMCEPFSGDNRLTYHYSPETLSFVANFGQAMELADGEYICFIGDDDGINPEILQVARWAREADVDAIKPGLQALYFWPGAGLLGEEDTGQLVIEAISERVRVNHTGAELTRLLRDGCQQYLERDLVKLYHGLVRRDVLERVRVKTGHYFGGLSPDIYAAVSLSTVTPKVLSMDYPLTVSGICRTSGSADSATGRHTGELKDAPHFKGHDAYEWAQEVPRFYSVETIWADSSIAALREMGRAELLSDFRPQYLAAYCMQRHPAFKGLVLSHYQEFQRGRHISRWQAGAALTLARVAISAQDLAARVGRKLTGRGRIVRRMTGVEDIESAAVQLSRFLATEGPRIETVLAHLDRLLQARTAEP